ncbi:piggyBac transposable element-derived protein 4-like [Octodon degus]|uniref:PiggyBac transposable element-derived protein 4-like n=1 Tax=Octodon degus TaxID=10160 RepID=A0A6P6E0X5_OCTDE|nr:piggyBac transposable element-derived protein 4-like [Octodon degus]XP_023565843.1 piggyBac transposable element-derived protein 4-like [Octodon degus]
MAHENPDLQVLGEVESESSGDSSTEDDDIDIDTDHLSQRSCTSEMEQELTDTDTGNDDLDLDDENISASSYLTSQNATKWSRRPEQSNVRTRSEDARLLAGVNPIGRNANTAIQCWKLIITDDMLQDVVKHTNIEIQLKRSICTNSHTQKCVYYDTSLFELKAFIGLLYLAGLSHANRSNVKDLWRSDGCGLEVCRITMTLRRFGFLQNCLRFDDKTTRQERKRTDNLAAIRSFFESFLSNCQAIYTPSEYMTIAEQLAAFHGRCSFRQCLPNKPSKYGIKIYTLVDAKTYYTFNLEIYPGIQPPGPYSCSNKPNDIINRLVAPISQSNRNVTFNSWFTSYPLMLHLLREHHLTSVGTIRKNKAEIPHEMLQVRNRELYSTIFGFQKDITLASYMAKKNKVVLLMSTLHHDGSIDRDTSTQMKPEMETFYNKTKGGVDTVDELCSNYDVTRNTKRWPMIVFYSILNMSGINSFIVYKENNKCKISRRNFLRGLGLELIREQLQRKRDKMFLPRELHKTDLELTGQQPGTSQRPTRTVKKPKRCQLCPKKKDRKTKHTCYQCKGYLCMEHAVLVCEDCLGL